MLVSHARWYSLSVIFSTASAIFGLLALATEASGQFISLQKPKVSVAIHHPAGAGVTFQHKKVAFGQISGPCAQQFSDLLVPIFQANSVEIVNREQLNAVLAEHRFQVSSSVDPTTAVALGKVLGPSVMIFVTVSRCSAERSLVYEDQFVGPRVNVSRTQAHFLASVHTVDLATGRELAVQSLETNPRKENRATTGVAEYPGEFEVQDMAVHEAAIKAQRLYFPWEETRQVPFMNSKDCNLKAAYDLLRAGDNAAALKQSKENVEACKSDPKVNHRADAFYNLGIAYLVADDYDNALQAMTEANKLHSDKTTLDALADIRQAKAGAETVARSEAEQVTEAERAKGEQAARSQEEAKATLTNDSVVRMVKGGLSEEVVVRMIANQPARFAVAPDDLLALKAAGVPDKVIAAMLDKK